MTTPTPGKAVVGFGAIQPYKMAHETVHQGGHSEITEGTAVGCAVTDDGAAFLLQRIDRRGSLAGQSTDYNWLSINPIPGSAVDVAAHNTEKPKA